MHAGAALQPAVVGTAGSGALQESRRSLQSIAWVCDIQRRLRPGGKSRRGRDWSRVTSVCRDARSGVVSEQMESSEIMSKGRS